MQLFLLIIGALIIWILIIQWKRRKIFAEARKIRNKYIAWPVIGHGYMLLGTKEKRMDTIKKICREAIKNKNGMTGFWLGHHFLYVTCDAMDAETISKTYLSKPVQANHIARHLLETGLFSPQEINIWRPRRKMLAPTFSQKNLDNFVKIFSQQSCVMANCLRPMAGAGTFSIWNYALAYSMDAGGLNFLGSNLYTQRQPNHPLLSAFLEYISNISDRIGNVWLHWDPLFKCMPQYTIAEEKRKIMHDYVDKMIHRELMKQKLRNINNDSLKKTEGEEHLSTFLKHCTSSNKHEGFSDEEIREEALVLLLVGSDTSSTAISFSILMLSRHLDVQQKVFEEIREVFGDSKRPVTLEDILNLKYLDAVVREILRLYPPAPAIIRENDREVQISSGLTIAAGTLSVIGIWGINRNPRYWGEDAEEFKPDRFLKGPLENPSAFATFSLGPRGCIGYQNGILSIKVSMVNLLREYQVLPPLEIRPEDLKKPFRLTFDIVIRDMDNYKVRLECR